MNAARAPKDLFAAARRILRPTIFPAGFFEPGELPSLDDLEARLKTLAGERPLTYTPGAGAYPEFDTFLAVIVKAGGEFVAMIADRWDTEADRDAALVFLRGRA